MTLDMLFMLGVGGHTFSFLVLIWFLSLSHVTVVSKAKVMS